MPVSDKTTNQLAPVFRCYSPQEYYSDEKSLDFAIECG